MHVLGGVDAGAMNREGVAEKEFTPFRREPSAIELATVKQIVTHAPHVEQHSI